VNGKLTGKVLGKILDAQGKGRFPRCTREAALGSKQVIAMGDGANDLKMMAQASVSIAYHAKPVVRSQATYAFNFVGWTGWSRCLAAKHSRIA
jgi:phosphoserine phosphatase